MGLKFVVLCRLYFGRYEDTLLLDCINLVYDTRHYLTVLNRIMNFSRTTEVPMASVIPVK